MTRPRQIGPSSGFTVWELVIVILIIIGIAGMAVAPAFTRPKDNRRHTFCASNLKQIATGFRMYANDNDGKYPGFNATNETWQYFQAAGEQLSSPSILMCSLDKERPKARCSFDFQFPPNTNSLAHPNYQNNSVSYFYGVDASSENPRMWLAGDRNLAINQQPFPGLATIKSNTAVSWTTAIHNQRGNIVLVDGSVQQTTTETLRKALAAGTNETQRLMFP